MSFPYGRFQYGRAMYSAGMQQGARAGSAVSGGTRTGLRITAGAHTGSAALSATRAARLAAVGAHPGAALSDGTRAAQAQRRAAHAGSAASAHAAAGGLRATSTRNNLVVSSSIQGGIWVANGIAMHMAVSCGRRFGGAYYVASHAGSAASGNAIIGRLVWEPEDLPVGRWMPPAPIPDSHWTVSPPSAIVWEATTPSPVDIWTPHPLGSDPWTPEIH